MAALTDRVSAKPGTRLQGGQSGRREPLLLQSTVERPATLPESSTCVIKRFALKVKKYKYCHYELKRVLLLESRIVREARKATAKTKLMLAFICSQSVSVRWPTGTESLHKDLTQPGSRQRHQTFYPSIINQYSKEIRKKSWIWMFEELKHLY